MQAVTIALVLGAIAVGAAGCGGGSSSGSGSGKIELDMDNYYFEPGAVKAAAGNKTTLELKNDSATEHNFTLTEQGVSKDVEAGEEAEVTVTVPKSGTLTFYCKYHRSRGMTGTLEAGKSSPY
jgi:plastocyanin